MVTCSGELTHADRDGEVIIPRDAARSVLAAPELCMRRGKPLLDVCKSVDFSIDLIEKAMEEAGGIH